MSDSVYKKTPLPPRLNLSDRNTRQQLEKGALEDDGRGTLEGVQSQKVTAAQSKDGCNDVMRKDLRDWLARKGISGPPPSPEAEQRAMWQWIRDFHKEYNDDWFSRNMPRLLTQFRPLFMEEMKRMKAEVKAVAEAKASKASPPSDLLDLVSSSSTAQPAAPAATCSSAPRASPQGTLGGGDLFSMGVDTKGQQMLIGTSSASQSRGGGGGLLDLDVGPAAVSAPAAPAVAATSNLNSLLGLEASDPFSATANQPAAGAPQSQAASMHRLDDPFAAASGASGPPQHMQGSQATTQAQACLGLDDPFAAPVPQPAAAKGGLDLLDLM